MTLALIKFILKELETNNELVINLQVLKSDIKLLYKRIKCGGDILSEF